ncbi:MAG: hypothetical protein JO076_05075 [Verrucomicrobia bacterium]|nr:hypothetical protein [Verrucomicrobiota bacterium]
MLLFLIAVGAAQQATPPPGVSGTAEPTASPAGQSESPAEPVASPVGVLPAEPGGGIPLGTPSPVPGSPSVDDLEQAIRQHDQERQQQEILDPARPRTIRFTGQPVGRILRSLAEQAGINYVEPAIPESEITSIVLTNMTPLQAFAAVARAHGFRVRLSPQDQVYTLARADLVIPSYYEIRRYTLKYQSAPDLIQAVAGYLGIQVRPAAPSNPAYPKPLNVDAGTASNSGINGEVGGATQSLYSGTEQTQPRFISGLPFDEPLSTGGFGNSKENAVWIERSSNSLLVRATPDEHSGLSEQIRIWDRPEDQLQINTYVIEISKNDDLFGGVDWSNTLGQNGATFTLTGNVGATPSTIVSHGLASGFFNNGLILQFPNVSATIRALTQKGKLRSTNSPVTYTKTGMPVQIRSVTQQTIFLQTAATANVQATTTPYTFTTGLTIDVVGRILRGGIIDLKINPALSTETGQSPAQPGTTTTVPIISTRTATADVEVRSGDAAVIGGITADENNYQENGIPGLRSVPLLGYLFKTRQRQQDRTNLVIIVWPRIIKGTFVRKDRLGSDERETLENLGDLPGEPPPMSYGREGKQLSAKAPIYYNDPAARRKKKRHSSG